MHESAGTVQQLPAGIPLVTIRLIFREIFTFGSPSMIRVVGSLLARHMALIALFVTGVPAWAESVERVEQVERAAPGVPAGNGHGVRVRADVAPGRRAAVRL